MQKKALNTCVALVVLGCVGTPAVAADLKIGNPETDLGELSVSGFLRAKFQDKSWDSTSDNKLTFDAARINVDYKSPKIFGHLEYRCYQFDKLCDFSTLVDAYAGYNINDKHLIQAGLQAVPFGPGRFWESNYYGGVVTKIGLEDAHNVGVKYQGKFDSGTKVELGYFSNDGGTYGGPYSKDASRYTSNYVKPENADNTYLDETNMFVARVQQDISGLPEGLSSNVGASYWYSDIDNKTYNTTGDRKAWALFGNLAYNDLALAVTVGQNDVDNKDPSNSKTSLMGSFDDNYFVANKGTFYTADVSYSFKNVGKFDSISTYAMYSSYDKDEAGFKTSSRNLVGMAAYYKDITFVAEYIMGKNDFLIGGPSNSYAEGTNDGTEKLLNLQLYYNF